MTWLNQYEGDGIANVELLTRQGFLDVRTYVRSWITGVIKNHSAGFMPPSALSAYHTWQENSGFPHGEAFTAPARFTNPPLAIESLLISERVNALLRAVGCPSWELVDEGMGWLGYRIIRPGAGDGYPLSRKNWGASQGVISFWIPMFGFGKEYALKYVSGSQSTEYRSYLPTDSQFTKGELRLSPDEEVTTTSQYVRSGNGLIYGPNLLHTENVASGRKTRVNLEFRVSPR